MKKTLVSALTTALVVGAASTTFAAANPFEDVPADHWAYDAVAQLAADGVIEGYGDGTYRGDQEITRYEMAQMVARAMAKSGVSDADKAMIDKLAAEFADELNNLGVRVAALEKKVDNVKWTGKLRYRYIDKSVENNYRGNKKVDSQSGRTNQYLLRLEPKMTINEHWTGKARIDYGTTRDFADASNITGDQKNAIQVDRIYAEGKYGMTTIDLGKFPETTKADYGMMLDYRIAGAGVTTGNKLKVNLYAGRINLENAKSFDEESKGTASLQGIEVYNDRADKFTYGIGYQHISNKAIFDDTATKEGLFGNKDANLMNLGLGYKFNDKLSLTAAYAKNFSVDSYKTDAYRDDSTNDQSYNFQLKYGGSNPAKVGSWGVYAAYRHLGKWATVRSTYSENGPINSNERGWEIGGEWTVLKNIQWKAAYFMGNKIDWKNDSNGVRGGDSVRSVWTELNLFF